MECEKMLKNLLAVLHRDGGHYTKQHGIKKSVKDAISICLPLLQENNVPTPIKGGMKMPTDTERINFMEKLTSFKNYPGKVILRMSTTGRGWRLHETSRKQSSTSVRDAIDKAIYEYKTRFYKKR